MSMIEVQTKASHAQSNLIASEWICLPKPKADKQEQALINALLACY